MMETSIKIKEDEVIKVVDKKPRKVSDTEDIECNQGGRLDH